MTKEEKKKLNKIINDACESKEYYEFINSQWTSDRDWETQRLTSVSKFNS